MLDKMKKTVDLPDGEIEILDLTRLGKIVLDADDWRLWVRRLDQLKIKNVALNGKLTEEKMLLQQFKDKVKAVLNLTDNQTLEELVEEANKVLAEEFESRMKAKTRLENKMEDLLLEAEGLRIGVQTAAAEIREQNAIDRVINS
jgi:hypothetical protein